MTTDADKMADPRVAQKIGRAKAVVELADQDRVRAAC